MSLDVFSTSLLVPPVDLLVPCIAGAALLRRRPRLGGILFWGGLILLLGLSLPWTAERLLVSLEQGLPLAPSPDAPPQAIVILSGDVARAQRGLEVGALTLERERAGAALARRTGLPVLVTGGTLDGTATTLGSLMAQSLAADFAVAPRWIEPRAQDTRENARFSADILRAASIRSIYLVTHAWHMKRSLLAYRNTGMTVVAAPVRMDRLPPFTPAQLAPSAEAWLVSYFALHEWIGCLAAWLDIR